MEFKESIEQKIGAEHTLQDSKDSDELYDQINEISESSICGKLPSTQKIDLDFTPNNLDNDTVQQKCIELWELIGKNQDMKNLLITPIPKVKSSSSSILVDSNSSIEKSEQQYTAMSMLKFINEKGLIDPVFKAKMPISHCTINNTQNSGVELARSFKKGARKGRVCKVCSDDISPRDPSVNVQALCEELANWDEEHPKSLKPPGHAPNVNNF